MFRMPLLAALIFAMSGLQRFSTIQVLPSSYTQDGCSSSYQVCLQCPECRGGEWGRREATSALRFPGASVSLCFPVPASLQLPVGGMQLWSWCRLLELQALCQWLHRLVHPAASGLELSDSTAVLSPVLLSSLSLWSGADFSLYTHRDCWAASPTAGRGAQSLVASVLCFITRYTLGSWTVSLGFVCLFYWF